LEVTAAVYAAKGIVQSSVTVRHVRVYMASRPNFMTTNCCDYRYTADTARLQLLANKQLEAHDRVMAAKQAASATDTAEARHRRLSTISNRQ